MLDDTILARIRALRPPPNRIGSPRAKPDETPSQTPRDAPNDAPNDSPNDSPNDLPRETPRETRSAAASSIAAAVKAAAAAAAATAPAGPEKSAPDLIRTARRALSQAATASNNATALPRASWLLRAAGADADALNCTDRQGRRPAQLETCGRPLPDGGAPRHGPAGEYWHWRRGVERLWPRAPSWVATVDRGRKFDDESHREPPGVHSTVAEHPELSALRRVFPRAALLDLETCGFSGSAVFLAGAVVPAADGSLELHQLLARHYGEERAMLASLRDLLTPWDVLLTFNGKSFDWPVLRDRLALHGLPGPGAPAESWPLTHCDLLHHCRRRFAARLPDCKLQTLEQWVCGRRRSGDIPGQEIPTAYHQFVRSGDAWEMQSVLHHNALDLVTLLQLAVALLREGRSPL